MHTNLHMTEVNPHLICALCGGYLVDATTIVECLHSFCKTCIVRYLESSKFCPVCDVMVHKKRPLQRIRPDPILQDLVYKIVPGLFKEEMGRRREFYEKSKTEEEKCEVSAERTEGPRIIFSADEKISLILELCPYGVPVEEDCDKLDDNLNLRDCRNLLCPASLTIAHLKKFIRIKFSLSSRYQIDVFHSRESLQDDYTLIDIAYISSWKRKGELRLYYSIFENPAKRMRLEIPVPRKTHAKILASTPRTKTGTSTQLFHCPSFSTTRMDHCATSTTQTTCSGPCSIPTKETVLPGDCPNVSRLEPCDTFSKTSRSAQYARTTTQRLRPGQCTSAVTQTSQSVQCTSTIPTGKPDLCAESISSTPQPAVPPCRGYEPPNTVQILCSTVSAPVANVNDSIIDNSTDSADTFITTDRAVSITEEGETVVCDTHHSTINDNVSQTEMAAREEKQAGSFSDNTTCLDSATTDCTDASQSTAKTADVVSSGVEACDHSVVQNGDISEAETEDYETVCNSNNEKDPLKEIDFSNVDENRNQKLQNDVHTQTDSDALHEITVVLPSETVLKESKVTETAQTQTSFSPDSQLSQTIRLLREKIALTEQKSVCAENSYKQTNSDKINAKSSEKDDEVNVVVEEVPCANIPILLENRTKYLDHSGEYHYNATVNGFYRDSDEKLTATVKQEVISDCPTETS